MATAKRLMMTEKSAAVSPQMPLCGVVNTVSYGSTHWVMNENAPKVVMLPWWMPTTNVINLAADPRVNVNNYPAYRFPSSSHPGGANVVFADRAYPIPSEATLSAYNIELKVKCSPLSTDLADGYLDNPQEW